MDQGKSLRRISASSKIEKEKKTVAFMIRFFCKRKHGCGELCPECRKLTEYALERLERCRFAENKKSCRHCPIHCYNPEMRARIREVMRYSGPRMFLFSPIEALRHI